MKDKNSGLLGLYVVLGLLFAVAFVISLGIGSIKVPLTQMIADLWSGNTSTPGIILWEIRLPRAILGGLIGATLGLAGAAMQGLLRNPLAEPGVLGVTGGAVVGAVLMLYTGIASMWALALPIGGMVGALISVVALYFLAGYVASIQTLILAGVALNTLAFAATSLILNLSPNDYASLEIVFWQMGSLANKSFYHVGLSLPFILMGWILLFWDVQALNALTLGEDTAFSLGIPMNRVRLRMIIGTALSVGAAVSVCGSIGFIGLVVPHLLRPFVKQEPGKLLGVSALGGAILLLFSDIAVRAISIGAELKLGVLTSLIGAPFFVILILKMRKRLS